MKFRIPLFRLPRHDSLRAPLGTKRFVPVEAFIDNLFPLWSFLDFSPHGFECETYEGIEE
jgi:hypothetical protein